MTYLSVEKATALGSNRWEWKPWRRVARIRREPNRRSDQRLLALSADKGLVPRPDDGGRQLPTDETISNYWMVRRHDVVFNPMWAFQGGVAVSELDGAVSTAYRIYTASKDLHPRFVHYFLRSRPAIEQFGLLIRGVTTFDRSVTREDFEGMPVPVPPIPEQRAIAEFLDRENSHIDNLVESHRSLADLACERLQVLVRSLTRSYLCSFGPRVTPGEVGWRRFPLGRCFARVDYGIGEASAPEGNIAVLGMANVAGGRVVGRPGGFVNVLDPKLFLASNDLLFNRTNSLALVGKVALFKGSAVQTTFASYLVRLKVARDFSAHYLNYLLNTPDVLSLARSMALPSIGQANLNPNRYSEIRVWLPDRQTQDDIVRTLKDKEEHVTATVDRCTQLVARLQDRRQALITAAVTGQIEISSTA